MRILASIFLLLMFAVSPLLSAANKPATSIDMNAPLRSQLSPNEVVKLAEEYLVKKGINPKEYQNRHIHLNLKGGGLEWSIFFLPTRNEKLTAVGDHFTVYVNDVSKKIDFMGGA